MVYIGDLFQVGQRYIWLVSDESTFVCTRCSSIHIIAPGHSSRGSLHKVYGVSRLSEDVTMLVPILPGTRAEERHPQHSLKMFCLSTDGSGTTLHVISRHIYPLPTVR